jgi:predicted acetyltransferase
MQPSLSFAKIGPKSEAVLRDLFQHYLRDMAEWFDVETGTDSSHIYDLTGISEKGQEAYLAMDGDIAAGFALVRSGAKWQNEIDFPAGTQEVYDVHEFFVLREFRRRGVGQRMANHIWNEYPGEWLIRALEANTPALAFWRAAIAGRAPKCLREEDRIVNGRSWVFLRFTSPGTQGPAESLAV